MGKPPSSFLTKSNLTNHFQTIGTVQIAARLNFFLFGQVCQKMSLFQRFCGLVFSLGAISTVPLTVSLLLFPVAIGSGSRLITYTDPNQLRWLIRVAFLTLFANRINEWIAFAPAGYRFAWRGNLGLFWMAPCQCSYPHSTPPSHAVIPVTDSISSSLRRSRDCNYPLVRPSELARR